MKKSVVDYVSECLTCLRVKVEHQKPTSKLQPLPILGWKWEHIMTNLLMGLPKTDECHGAIWVVIDCLTKSVHFIPFRVTYSRKALDELYMTNVV